MANRITNTSIPGYTSSFSEEEYEELPCTPTPGSPSEKDNSELQYEKLVHQLKMQSELLTFFDSTKKQSVL